MYTSYGSQDPSICFGCAGHTVPHYVQRHSDCTRRRYIDMDASTRSAPDTPPNVHSDPRQTA